MKRLKLNAFRVIRGGGWNRNAFYLRVAFRLNRSSSIQSNGISTRLVRSKR
jgi:formylglycine-generating enzyme required for sulfatase activity